MACNCPGSGCQCVESSGVTVSVLGTGSAGNPYVHEAIISLEADNLLEVVPDGLYVPTPCFLVDPASTVANGNLLVEGADGCSVRRLTDPSLGQVLGYDLVSGNAAWEPLISGDATNQASQGSDGGVYVPAGAGSTVTDPCDVADTGTQRTQGNVLIQGGSDCRYERLVNPTACQFLGAGGSDGMGGFQAGWVDPNLVPFTSYASFTPGVDAPALPYGGSLGVPNEIAFLTVANPVVNCDVLVNIRANLWLFALGAPALAENIFDHYGGVWANRTVTGAAAGPNANEDSIGIAINNVGTSDASSRIKTYGSVNVWSRLGSGDSVTWHLWYIVNAFSGMDAAGFTIYLKNYSVQMWKAS